MSKIRLYGSLQSRLMESMNGQPTPQVGMGATECMHSDRHAYTIIEVGKNGKYFKMQQDTAIRIDNNGMSESQSYKYVPNPDGTIMEVKLTKHGWRVIGNGYNYKTNKPTRTTQGMSGVLVGYREEYYDFSF